MLRFASRSPSVPSLPERPRYRAPDLLRNKPRGSYTELLENITFNHRSSLLQPSASAVIGDLPSTFRKQREEKPRVSDDDIARIRQLRREDAATWTRGSEGVSLKAKAEMEELHTAKRAHWGERRSLHAEISNKCKKFW
ncbi:hypothetical protein V8D89_007728 [Ganoderma adspersum]